MNKKLLLGIVIVLILVVICFFSIKQKIASENLSENKQVSNVENTLNNNSVVNETEKEEISQESEEENADLTENTPKSEQKGTAGSNIPLKDNEEEAIYQIELAMQYLFEETYGDDVFDARIYVEKVYTEEDEAKNPILKKMNLGPDEVAFEVKFELKPSADADIDLLVIPDGEYDEESGWIKNMARVGVLRPNESGEQKYKITNYGTGF